MTMKLNYIFAPSVLFFVRQSKKNSFPTYFLDVTDGLTPLQLNKKYRK